MFDKLPSLKGLLLAGGLILAFIAALSGIYYAGFRAGGTSKELTHSQAANQKLQADFSALIDATNKIMQENKSYDALISKVDAMASAADCPVSPGVRAAIDGMPEPGASAD